MTTRITTQTRDMNRRTFLTRLDLAGAALALAPRLEVGQAQEPSTMTAPPAFYPFRLGNLELIVVSDGAVVLPPPIFVGGADPKEVNETLAEKFLPPDQLRLSLNCLLVKGNNEVTLIDTGVGQFAETSGKLLTNLEAAGVKPNDGTSVIITHAHGDHISGLLTNEGNVAFPNARVLISRLEWETWLGDHPLDLSKTQIPQEIQTGLGLATNPQKYLQPLEAVTERFEVNREILPGIEAIHTPGHTPGHVALNITSGRDSLLVSADNFSHFALALEHPEWSGAIDLDAVQSVESRRTLLERIAVDKSLVLPYHFPWPALGHIAKDGKRFAWIPSEWINN